MKTYQITIIGFISALLLWDWIFLERPYQRILKWLLLFLVAVTILLLNTGLFAILASFFEISRVSDLALYIITVILIREILLTRTRLGKKNREITVLTRELAKLTCKKIG